MNADRIGLIGGSDVAGILGLSPYSSPWSVWLEKATGEQADRSDDMAERLEIGKDAEQFLASVFDRHHQAAGLSVDLRQVELVNPEYPWLRGHADGMLIDVGTIAGGWEAKTDRAFAEWDEVPAFYQCQSQLYMALSGLDHWWFTVGFAGWKVKHYVVPADAEDQALIIKATETFWRDHVLTGVPPEADSHPATTAAIKRAYDTTDPDDIVWADDEAVAIVDALRVAKADAKTTEARVDELENRLKVRLGGCAEMRYGDETLATWKAQSAERLDTKALRAAMPATARKFTNTTTTRVLRVAKPKGK